MWRLGKKKKKFKSWILSYQLNLRVGSLKSLISPEEN